MKLYKNIHQNDSSGQLSAVPPIISDQFGRTFNYLRIAVNEICNLRCIYCMPEEGAPFKPSKELLTHDEIIRFIQVAAELGVNKIQPLTLDRCVKKTMNFERSQKIIISSAKQCYRSRFPVLHEPIDMKKLLKNSDGQFISGLMGADKSLSELELDKNVTVIIGPEGDFTENEIGQMKNAGVLFFNLGGRRLRAETAALNSLAVLNELFD